MSQITIVIDSTDEGTKNNNVLDPIFAANISHTMLPFCYLVEEAKKQGIEFVTSDIFLKNPEKYKDSVYLISHLVSERTDALIAKGVKPLIVTCQESPFIATRFYLGLRKFTSKFKYSILFRGMKKRTSKKTTFMVMYFPQFYVPLTKPAIDFKDRKLITMITANKGLSRTKTLVKSMILKILYGSNTKYVYGEREKLIEHFSRTSEFDLYGRDWDRSIKSSVKRSYRGVADNKYEVMRKYRFALCIENSVFNGYVTEKIFDAFFAGCVPIYLGAPDIHDFIPKETFIDMRYYKNLDHLQRSIESMTANTYSNYLREINDFLKSDRFKRFGHIEYAKDMINIIKQEHEKA